MKKNMFLFLAVLSILLSSCSSTYFYSALESVNDDVRKVENGDFLFKNDSLWIAYCFKGEDAPIQISIFNKLDVPLYINWQESALFINETPYPYSEGHITYMGGSEGIISESILFGVEEILLLPEYVSYVPPQSMVSYSTLRIAPQFSEIKNKKYRKEEMPTKEGKTATIQQISYNLQDTPLVFGSSITLYTQPEDMLVYYADFYVANLIKTKVKPQDLATDMADRGDTFYQCKRSNNSGWYILADIATIGIVSAVDVVVLGNDDND